MRNTCIRTAAKAACTLGPCISVRHIGLPAQTKIRATNYIRLKEKLTFSVASVTRCQGLHQSRPRGQTGFPPSVAVGYTNKRCENKLVIGERVTGKARQSICDVAAGNKSPSPSPEEWRLVRVSRFLIHKMTFLVNTNTLSQTGLYRVGYLHLAVMKWSWYNSRKQLFPD